jgi:hypothetical protein
LFTWLSFGSALPSKVAQFSVGANTMASAFVLATQCDLVDLDGTLHLQSDRDPPVVYREMHLLAPDRTLWG